MVRFWHGLADTGADTNVTESKLRDVLGRAALADTEVDLQGCTGSSDNRTGRRTS